MTAPAFNYRAIWAIYKAEMARFSRSSIQSIISPVLTTSLYFIVFGTAIGSRMSAVDGVAYGAFIVPGLMMLMLLVESLSNASFGMLMHKFSGTIYELLSAPVSHVEMVAAFVGAAVTKSLILAALVLGTSALFVPLDILHPGWMLAFLLLTSVTFCLFGFILGVWAKSWEQLWIVPGLIVTPLTFLGGAFYSIDMLPPAWQTVALFNPVVYLISGFRWSFFGTADVAIATSLGAVISILIICFVVVAWIFRTGYRLKN
jgi:ABC-2 type transport system permease protein